MDSWILAAALASAALHASWHAVVKSSAQPSHAMTAQMVGSAAICVPALFWSGLPALAAWPWMIGSNRTTRSTRSGRCTATPAATIVPALWPTIVTGPRPFSSISPIASVMCASQSATGSPEPG